MIQSRNRYGIHVKINELSAGAVKMGAAIRKNLEELGV